MAKSLDVKLLIKYLANGSLADNLCVVCLSPLEVNKYESIFKIICKEDKVYCIADVLETLCQVRFQNSDYYNICTDCSTAATSAYKFYQTVKQTDELLNSFTDKLLSSIEDITINPETTEHILFISLHKSETTRNIDNKTNQNPITSNQTNLHTDKIITNNSKPIKTDEKSTNNDTIDSDSEEIIVSIEDDKAYYFKVETDGSLTQVKEDQEEESQGEKSQDEDEEFVMIVNEKKERKKRDPLNYVNCTRCPVKYRFISKLRDHMKSVHNIDIFYCKICRIITEQKDEYNKHLLTHTGEYQCTLCNAVYKKERTLLTHMEWHERTKNVQQTENSNICELCGVLVETEDKLQHHYIHKHLKKYTCYYCSRMYKGEAAFNLHITKHEDKMKLKSTSHNSARIPIDKSTATKRSVCTTCGKDFVDERSLLWHQRLHDNDKPYACDKCDRSFVSAQRRNQHALCAHTPPTRRCPLCPALFHLRSMVNTHVKKVHLKTHKRRNRTSKYENVLWKTKTVPIEELSISVQDEILELQAKDGAQVNDVVMNETANSTINTQIEY